MMKRHLPLLCVLALALSACAGILGLRPPGRRPFEHRAHVIEGVSCLKCHAGVTTAGDTGPLHLPTTQTCNECHEEAHDTRECSMCHGLAGTRAAAAQAREALHFDHAQHLPRTKGDCVRCHVDVQQGSEHLRPTMGTCLGCHNHSDEMVVRKCDGCHVDLEKEGIQPEDWTVHGPDFMKEHGVRSATNGELCGTCHAEKFCVGCHAAGVAPATPARLALGDPFVDSVHRAGFFARHSLEARSQPGLCTTCHAPSTCTTCHERSSVAATASGAKSPHPRGWLGLPGQPNEHGREAWRDPANCASCHGGAGEKLCVNCHRVGGVGGNPHPPGYVARGNPRTDTPCRMCHGAPL